MKKGLIYKGHFWPLYGGGVLYNSPNFYHGGMEDICPTIRAEKSDVAVCVEFEIEDEDDKRGNVSVVD